MYASSHARFIPYREIRARCAFERASRSWARRLLFRVYVEYDLNNKQGKARIGRARGHPETFARKDGFLYSPVSSNWFKKTGNPLIFRSFSSRRCLRGSEEGRLPSTPREVRLDRNTLDRSRMAIHRFARNKKNRFVVRCSMLRGNVSLEYSDEYV